MAKQNNTIKGLKVEVRDGNINVAIRKLKKKVDESGLLLKVLSRQHYEKPTTKRKRKAAAARARWLKKVREQKLPKQMY